jgi:hypothetical protein
LNKHFEKKLYREIGNFFKKKYLEQHLNTKLLMQKLLNKHFEKKLYRKIGKKLKKISRATSLHKTLTKNF